MATLMLCYLLCAMHTGVILYRRKVFAYEVLTRVTKNVVFFAILGGGILQLGGYMDAWSKLFLAYLLAVLVCVSVFRLGLRMLIKVYRTKGGNLRYVGAGGQYGQQPGAVSGTDVAKLGRIPCAGVFRF